MQIFECTGAVITVEDCPTSESCEDLYLAESANSYVMKGGVKVALANLLFDASVDRIVIDERLDNKYVVINVEDANRVSKIQLTAALLEYYELKKRISSGKIVEVIALVNSANHKDFWPLAKLNDKPRIMRVEEILDYLQAAGLNVLVHTEVAFTSDWILLDSAIQKIKNSGLSNTPLLLKKIMKREKVIHLIR